MKAPVFKGVGIPLSVEDVPDPVPGAGEVVLKVGRCGICGTDLHKTSSHVNPFKPGTVIGHEFAGEVVAIGAGVDVLEIGDKVAVLPLASCGRCTACQAGDLRWCEHGVNIWYGGAGQYVLAKAHAAIKLPATLSIEDGALIEPLAVSLHAVNLAGLRPGGHVLVLGAGAIGLATTLWARQLGAGRITVASRSARGEAMAMEFGATDFAIFGEGFAEHLARAPDGPPEVVFECIGQPGSLARAVDTVRGRGTVILVGNCMEPDLLTPSVAMFKEVRIQGSSCYAVRDFEQAIRMFEAGRVDPSTMISERLTYATLAVDFEALRHATGRQGKVMIDPWRQS